MPVPDLKDCLNNRERGMRMLSLSLYLSLQQACIWEAVNIFHTVKMPEICYICFLLGMIFCFGRHQTSLQTRSQVN